MLALAEPLWGASPGLRGPWLQLEAGQCWAKSECYRSENPLPTPFLPRVVAVISVIRRGGFRTAHSSRFPTAYNFFHLHVHSSIYSVMYTMSAQHVPSPHAKTEDAKTNKAHSRVLRSLQSSGGDPLDMIFFSSLVPGCSGLGKGPGSTGSVAHLQNDDDT